MAHIILENTICGNAGDGAVMIAAENIIREACGEDVKVMVFDHDAKTSQELYPEQEIHQMFTKKLYRFAPMGQKQGFKRNFLNFMSRMGLSCAKRNLWGLCTIFMGRETARGLKAYKTADMVVTTGGAYLNENFNLRERIKGFQTDVYLKNPPVFFTQSLGPFKKLENRKGLKPVFDASPLILLRDEQSQRHLNNIMEEPQKCGLVADSVFSLAEVALIEKCIRDTGPLKMEKVAISVRQWPYFKERPNREGMEIYMEAISALVQKLIRDYEVDITFISTCQGLDHFKYNDSKVAQKIYDMLPEAMKSHVTITKEFHHPSEIMDILRDMDLVVATRLYMMILGLCVGTPVLPISYEFKTEELCGILGLKDIMSNIENITAGDLMGHADILLNHYDEYRDKMLHATLERYESAWKAADYLEQVYYHGASARFSPSISMEERLDEELYDEAA